MGNKYDSKQDTLDHIEKVRGLLREIEANIGARAHVHDESKLQEPEKSMYDEFTPKLRELTYGSDEYKECLKQMGTALKHHYEHNSHHPEHFVLGINGMTLLDLIEMVADWKAASMRHSDGDFRESIEINRKRFKISPELYYIILATAEEMGW